MSTILVTGGAGFIGSHYVRHLLRSEKDVRVVNVDLLTYSGNLENLADVEGDPRYRFVRADIADKKALEEAAREGVDEIVHLAAESHVDRSIEDAGAFLRANVTGTQVLLDLARAWKVKRFVHVSTDEVYGSLGPEGRFTEETPLAPNSPYAASKAGSDLLVRAAHHTHGVPAVITRCSNNYGPNQFPEKLIPLMITNAIEGRELPVYGDGLQVRDWIHVEDHCRGIEAARKRGQPGQVYNLGAGNERPNLEIVRMVLRELGRPESLLRHVADRLGHDRRYAIDPAKSRRELGFEATTPFEQGLPATVRWYREHEDWWRRVKSGAYQDYYRRHYGARMGGS
jgi:dTDP-glucose 4,6-dehydratase